MLDLGAEFMAQVSAVSQAAFTNRFANRSSSRSHRATGLHTGMHTGLQTRLQNTVYVFGHAHLRHYAMFTTPYLQPADGRGQHVLIYIYIYI